MRSRWLATPVSCLFWRFALRIIPWNYCGRALPVLRSRRLVCRDLNGEKQAETLAGEGDASEEIARIRRRLATLDAERLALKRELESLEQKQLSDRQTAERTAFVNAPVTNSSSSAKKIGLFRRLFAGRPDVFPVRWEKQEDRQFRIFPSMLERMGKGDLRQAEGEMRTMPASGIHSTLR